MLPDLVSCKTECSKEAEALGFVTTGVWGCVKRDRDASQIPFPLHHHQPVRFPLLHQTISRNLKVPATCATLADMGGVSSKAVRKFPKTTKPTWAGARTGDSSPSHAEPPYGSRPTIPRASETRTEGNYRLLILVKYL